MPVTAMLTVLLPLAAASGPIQIPLWFDLTAVVLGALAGAAAARRRHFDLIGALVLATVMGLGGGIIRDILIGFGPPAALQDNRYLLAVAFACLVGSFVTGWAAGTGAGSRVLDALALGVYAGVGLQKGLANRMPATAGGLLGTVAATGGGLLTDILIGAVPQVLQPGHWQASAALTGCILYVALDALGVTVVPLGIVTVAVIVGLRLLSLRFGWATGEPREIARLPRSFGRRKGDDGKGEQP